MVIRADKREGVLSRYWFPAALVALLLLAIPGFVLFGLYLFGADGPANRSLEDSFQVSYHLFIPWWGALLLLLVPFAILVLYFLKLKRKPLAVPSTFLWRKSVEDLHVNSLLQWLRQNVLLLLQLLTVLALIYGIMAFRFHGSKGESRHYIIMIDNSASMSATDVAPNRLEWAKQEALKEIDARSDQDIGMVVVFNSNAEIRQSNTSNRQLLRDAVRKIEPTQRTTRIEEALSLADSQANQIRSTEDVASRPEGVESGKERTYVAPRGIPTDVHLYSDGRFPDLSETALAGLNSRLAGNESALGNLNVHFHLAGKEGAENVDNVALVALNALRDDRDPTLFPVFARVLNFRPTEVRIRVRLEVHVNGALAKVYEQPLTLPARKVLSKEEAGKGQTGPVDLPGEGAATFNLSDIDNRSQIMVRAQLLDVKDAFPLDDEAWLVVNVPRKARVLVVGKPNDVLDKFFTSEEVLEVAQVDQLAPGDLTGDKYLKAARNGSYDLIIFDRCGPAKTDEMPRSHTFFIGYPPPRWDLAKLEKVSNPQITGWMGTDPIMRYLKALYAVQIDQAFKIPREELPARTPLLIEGRRFAKEGNVDLGVLLALKDRESFTDLVLTFPILDEEGKWNTLWPLDASFPLFLRNVLYQLGNLSESAVEESIQPGQIKRLVPDGSVKRIEVIGADGKGQTLTHAERDLRTDFAYGATERVGVYRVKWDGRVQRSFAVNLLDPEESNIEPRAVLQFGSDQVKAGQERRQPRELWKWFVLAALALVLAEWYIYNRRIYI